MNIPVRMCQAIPITFPPSDCAEYRISISVSILNGDTFVKGDLIHYVIDLSNSGDIYMQTIKVVNNLDDTVFSLSDYEPGESVSLDLYHIVTEEESLQERLKCTVTAIGTIVPGIDIRSRASVTAMIGGE